MILNLKGFGSAISCNLGGIFDNNKKTPVRYAATDGCHSA